jgi:hypothetical protein
MNGWNRPPFISVLTLQRGLTKSTSILRRMNRVYDVDGGDEKEINRGMCIGKPLPHVPMF